VKMSASTEMQPEKDQKQLEVQTPQPSPAVAAPPPLKADIIKAFITTGVVILLTPLTVSLTFLFTAALQSPRPSIEESTPTLFYEPVPLGHNLQVALASHPTTAAHLREEILMRTGPDELDCVGWMKDFNWSYDCAQTVQGALEKIGDEAKSALQNPFERSPEISRGIMSDIKAINTIEAGINAAQQTPATSRTGDFQINLGVYNSGSSDGVVKSLASFTFDGGTVSLGSKTWTPVKSHSFANATFSTWIVSVSGEEAAREQLQNKVKKHEKVHGTLTINMSEKLTSTQIDISAQDEN
jgi:hypothetical protein